MGRMMKLYEASLSVVVRIRLAPSLSQVVLDSLDWSDSLRVQALAGADGWVEFAEKVSRIPELNNMKGLPHGQQV